MVTESSLDSLCLRYEMSSLIKYLICQKTMNKWWHMVKISWNFNFIFHRDTKYYFLAPKPGFNHTHQCPSSHWSLAPCVQSCTKCRPSSVPAGQTQTSVRSAPWSCTGSSDPASEADEGGATGVQSWGGGPRKSKEERQVQAQWHRR